MAAVSGRLVIRTGRGGSRAARARCGPEGIGLPPWEEGQDGGGLGTAKGISGAVPPVPMCWWRRPGLGRAGGGGLARGGAARWLSS